MQTPESGSIPISDIPEIFYSDRTGKPFSHCINCDCFLLDGGIPYVIEKAVKKYTKFNTEDTIFEHAMCINCQRELRKTLSLQSRKRIDDYMTQKVDFEERRKSLQANHGPDPEPWLSKCIVDGSDISEQSEYQVYCQCEGLQTLYAYMPFMISGSAMEEIQNLLSAETRDEIDRFMGEFFGLPPELKPLDQPLLLF
jgi:hypothetical protein